MAGKPLGAGIGPIPCADAVGSQSGVQLHARRAGQCGPRGGQLRKAVRRIAVFIYSCPNKAGASGNPQSPAAASGPRRCIAGCSSAPGRPPGLRRTARRTAGPRRGKSSIRAFTFSRRQSSCVRAAAGRVVRRVKGRVGGRVKIVVKVDAVHSVPCAQLPPRRQCTAARPRWRGRDTRRCRCT